MELEKKITLNYYNPDLEGQREHYSLKCEYYLFITDNQASLCRTTVFRHSMRNFNEGESIDLPGNKK